MPRTHIICLGKLKEQYLKDAVSEYTKRLGKYTNLTISELAHQKTAPNLSPSETEIVKIKEGERVLTKLAQLKGYTVFPLALCGKNVTSQEFAMLINQNPQSVFIIGASHGLSKDVLATGSPISFSSLTFSHQIMRIILLEQIYRGYKILNNEPYHK
ncbi:MAG: 23S rRNA (pseudouridine(1915)-N(3))-methyltransferase RlmH [Defluviitaleaceae bacterium]|nr:23S rRNA (pseudouridine(1915)-N(3))-methyltransferase RlmH [Defluviitaleaceae bacterium]